MRGLTILASFYVVFATSALLQAEFIISEFLAKNSGTLITDEDGFPADWIEIHNPDPFPASLTGYSLTDDSDNLRKWIFPDVTIPANGYLRVFATSKDRTANTSLLHTNFQLNSSGEFLALVTPDGTTIADSFAPAYPPQFQDISYGLGKGGFLLDTTFVPVSSPITYFVPSSDIGDSWQLPSFDDSSWTNATSAVGFGYNGQVGAFIGENGDTRSVMFSQNTSIYLRFPFEITDLNGVGSMQLKVKADDGFVAYLNGEEVAKFNSPETLTFNSRAPGAEEVDAGEDFLNFIIDTSNNLVVGENILAIHGLNRNITNNDFILISELVGTQQDSSNTTTRGYFATPSLNLPNGAPALPPPAEVSFDVTSQAFTNSLEVCLSHPDPNTTIHYTIDGSLPNPLSPTYSSPLTFEGSTQLRARAYLSGAIDGPSRSEAYLKIDKSQAGFSSDLPIVLISTFNNGEPPETNSNERKANFMLIYEPDPITGRATLSGTPHIATRGGFRKRGASSANSPKFSLNYESWDENDQDKDIKPLNFAPESDWIFNARFSFDLSLIRNPFMYDLSNQIGRWAVKTRFVELFSDNLSDTVAANDYFGVYSMMERIETDNNRLDIPKLDPWENSPEEITGGYIFQNDRADMGDPTFIVPGFMKSLIHTSPGPFDITTLQKDYLTNQATQTTEALQANDGIHPTTGLHFTDYLDVNSFIDNFWLNILAMDPDWGRFSQYFHQDRGGKIKAGPVWDYDRALGSRDGRDDFPARWEGVSSSVSFTWYDSKHEWFGLLFGFGPSEEVENLANPYLISERPDVFQQLVDRWYELRAAQFSQANMEATIDVLASEIEEAQIRNFARWPTLNPGLFLNNSFSEEGTALWEREVSHLKGWLKARSEWIDSQFIAPPTFSHLGGVVAENTPLTMTASEGLIYFTTDGSDPRAPGGAPSMTAIMATQTTITETTKVIARSLNGQEWGAPTIATFVINAEPANSSNLVISEIMYDPLPPTPNEEMAGYTSDDDFEYLEIHNPTNLTVNLSEVTFIDGFNFSFTDSAINELLPDGRALIVANRSAFLTRYGSDLLGFIAGEFQNDTGLSGSGERIAIAGGDGLITDFTYDNNSPWPLSPDNKGPSLVYISGDPSQGTNWRSSLTTHGAPGSSDSLTFTGDTAADQDQDGFNAFAEYALGTDDSVPNSEILTAEIDSQGRYTLTYPRQLAADQAEVILQTSSDMNHWFPAINSLEIISETLNPDGTLTTTYRNDSNTQETPKLFARLLISER